MSGFSAELQNQVITNTKGYLERAYNTDNWENGIRWYAKTNVKLHDLANARKTSFDKLAKLTSILSPSVPWDHNIEIALTLFDNHRESVPVDQIIIMGWKANKIKGYDFLDGKVDLLPKSRKTYPFYMNLSLNADYVTFDRWMMRELFTKEQLLNSNIKYEQLRDIFFNIADDHGILGYQVQAICWLQMQTESENKRIKVMYA